METSTEQYKQLKSDALIDFLLSNFHSKLKDDIAQATPLFERVVAVHGADEPHLLAAKKIFDGIAENLLQHLEKEEKILFPWILQDVDFASTTRLNGPIECMRGEHEHDWADIVALKNTMIGYEAPVGACGTYRKLLSILAKITNDTSQHMSIENEVLFARYC